jgi:hypothetical protein
MNNGLLFWKTIALRAELTELSRRCSYEALEKAVELLRANSIPAWKEPEIDWAKAELGTDKMERIQKDVAEKEAKGEKLDMDD